MTQSKLSGRCGIQKANHNLLMVLVFTQNKNKKSKKLLSNYGNANFSKWQKSVYVDCSDTKLKIVPSNPLILLLINVQKYFLNLCLSFVLPSCPNSPQHLYNIYLPIALLNFLKQRYTLCLVYKLLGHRDQDPISCLNMKCAGLPPYILIYICLIIIILLSQIPVSGDSSLTCDIYYFLYVRTIFSNKNLFFFYFGNTHIHIHMKICIYIYIHICIFCL